jgi:hypothetical protein
MYEETGEPDSSLFEIGDADDLSLVVEEPNQAGEMVVIEEEPSPEANKRRLSVSDHFLGQMQKLLKKTTPDGGVEFLPYNSERAQDYQPTLGHAKYEPILACEDPDDETKPKQQRCMLGYAAHHGPSLVPAEIRDNWENFISNTPTAAPRLSVAPPPQFKFAAPSFY